MYVSSMSISGEMIVVAKCNAMSAASSVQVNCSVRPIFLLFHMRIENDKVADKHSTLKYFSYALCVYSVK